MANKLPNNLPQLQNLIKRDPSSYRDEVMGPKRKGQSPAQKSAKAIAKKYRGKRMTPEKATRARRALYSVCKNEMSLRKAAKEYGLSYGFLQRRFAGEVGINKVKGPDTVFTEAEEEKMALWLSEMAQRGMGLMVCEFLDFIQNVVKKEGRKTPFQDGRPSYHWYTAFKNRNAHLIDKRTELDLELKRSKITKEVTDKWYNDFRDFLVKIDCLEKPKQIWNADETGFTMGSNKTKVIGPASRGISVPHITAGKQRLTVMYCGSANGDMMPPFFVYPEPVPRSYNPLNGSTEGSAIAYTKKGWMDTKTFSIFLDHFEKHAGPERPLVLLIDSVSSHVDPNVFLKARSKGIEMYKLVPNATHLMQPLDKGVFAPLKAKWNLVSRRYNRENPGRCIGKENFPQKLNEAFLMFYKPLTVINAFKSAGVYPVDASKITTQMLKPSETFQHPSDPSTDKKDEQKTPDSAHQFMLSEADKAKGALEALSASLSTPVVKKYKTRLEEGYDVEEGSPMYVVYQKLHSKAYNISEEASTSTSNLAEESTGLELLAEVALDNNPDVSCSAVSPELCNALTLPRVTEEQSKPVRRTLLKTLPDNLTSTESIRIMSLRELEKVKGFAEKEKRAKAAFLKKQNAPKKTKGKSKSNPTKGKQAQRKDISLKQTQTSTDVCKACLTTWEEDIAMDVERVWVQCDSCNAWMHAECISGTISETEQFICPDC